MERRQFLKLSGAAAAVVLTPLKPVQAAQVETLSVNKLSAISANIGKITPGIIRSADNKAVLDLSNKYLRIYD